MTNILSFIGLGVATGLLSGFFGVGGGIIMVPALLWLFHFNQHQAQGISLMAMLLPVGLMGAITYYQKNPFPIKSALWIACGMFLGTWVGSIIAQHLTPKQLKTSFGVLMILAAAKMILGK